MKLDQTAHPYLTETDILDRAPDRSYFDGAVNSREFTTDEGVAATLGVIQPGLHEAITVDPRGELLYLCDATDQVLFVYELTGGGDPVTIHELRRNSDPLQLAAGTKVVLMTPNDQPPVWYFCEFRVG